MIMVEDNSLFWKEIYVNVFWVDRNLTMYITENAAWYQGFGFL